MKEHNDALIPVRRPISGLMVDNVAQIIYDRLISEWGLLNAEQIGVALVYKLTAETTKRNKI